HRRHRGGAPRGRHGAAAMDRAAVRAGLALAARARRQSVVSRGAPGAPQGAPRLGRGDATRARRARRAPRGAMNPDAALAQMRALLGAGRFDEAQALAHEALAHANGHGEWTY